MILNDITQDNKKILGYKSNKTVKFHRLERSMEEPVSIFQSVVEAEQQNGGPQKILLLEEKKYLPAGQTRNRGWIKPLRDVRELKARL